MRIFSALCTSVFVALAGVARAGGFSARAPKAIYEIFVRSFQDGNGDGAGDLAGVIARLDQIAWLGVDAIWLTPTFPSPSTHGYDITDYTDANPSYGNKALFAQLISEAHRRHIRVYLDIAVNHTSIKHSWFQSSAKGGPDHDLYIWTKQPTFTRPMIDPKETPGSHWHKYGDEYYYSTFSPALPDLNWRNPEVLKRIIAVFQFWTKAGVDGFRLDAAKHLIKGPHGEDNQPETHQIWQAIARATRQVNPHVFFLGEIWDSEAVLSSYYGNGNELDAAFDFPLMDGIRQSVQKRDAGPFARALSENLRAQRAPDFALPFLGNHDLGRVASALGGDEIALKLAAAVSLVLPGSPVIYAGDEIGTPDGILPAHKADLKQRTPMAWNAGPNHGFTAPGTMPWLPFSTENPRINVESQSREPSSLLWAYRNLLVLREKKSALRWGYITDPRRVSANVVSFWRFDPRNSRDPVFVVLNFGEAPVVNAVIPHPTFAPGMTPEVLWGDARVQETSAGVQIDQLPARSALVGGYEDPLRKTR